jgi:ABC-type transport system substrate-binding protein
MAIVSRGALAAMGDADYGLKAVGTGPFKVVSHQLGQSMVLERFENYYDPERPKLDKVIITPINEPEPLAAAMEAGDIQFIAGNEVAPEILDRFFDNPDINVESVPAPGFEAVWINPWRDPFKVTDFDKPLEELMKEKGFMVRLALAKALDRDRFIERAQFGRAFPAYGTINPAMGYYFDDKLGETSNQSYDLEEARRLLAEAGYPNGEGFRELQGVVRTGRKREMEVIKDIYKRNLNIDVKVDQMDFPVLIDAFWAMDWDILRIGSAADFDPDDAVVDWMQTASKFYGPKRVKTN